MTRTSAQLPVGQPLHGASFGQSIRRFFRGYVTFSGRASRSEFWWAMLFTFLVSLVVQIPFWIAWTSVMVESIRTEEMVSTAPSASTPELMNALGSMMIFVVLMLLVSLALLLPTYAVMWRRLQDANFHGAFSLLSLVGFGIVPLIMCFLPSNPAGAQYDRGAGAFASQSWAADPYAQQPYGQQWPQQPAQGSWGQQPYGQAQQPYAQPYASPQGQQPGPAYGGPAYGEQSYGGQSYGGEPYGGEPYGQEPPQR